MTEIEGEGITKSSTNIKKREGGEEGEREKVFRLVALGSLLEGDRLQRKKNHVISTHPL